MEVKLNTRLLRAVSGDCGPANRNVLRGIARAAGQIESFDDTLNSMLGSGEIQMYGDRRGAVYGVPGLRRGKVR